jgi:hypothetical protein
MNKEYNQASEEEREAEYERCKDPLYLYNNYWQIDGKPVTPMTREEWDARKDYFELIRQRRVPARSLEYYTDQAIKAIRKFPLTPNEAIKK